MPSSGCTTNVWNSRGRASDGDQVLHSYINNQLNNELNTNEMLKGQEIQHNYLLIIIIIIIIIISNLACTQLVQACKGPVTPPPRNEKRETRNEKRETRNRTERSHRHRETRNEKRHRRSEYAHY